MYVVLVRVCKYEGMALNSVWSYWPKSNIIPTYPNNGKLFVDIKYISTGHYMDSNNVMKPLPIKTSYIYV